MAPKRAGRAATPSTLSTSSTPSTTQSTPSKPTSTSPRVTFASTLQQLWSSYLSTTPKQLKLCDALQFFLMLTGIAQFLYCVLVTNYPFNAFLGGFSATVGQFVLTASLRSQVNPENKQVFPSISPERAFADFVFGSMVLHFFVFSYLG